MSCTSLFVLDSELEINDLFCSYHGPSSHYQKVTAITSHYMLIHNELVTVYTGKYSPLFYFRPFLPRCQLAKSNVPNDHFNMQMCLG